jgi:hypothetical protein
MNAPIDLTLRKKWDDKLEAFKIYAAEITKKAKYIEGLVENLLRIHDDYVLLLADVAKSSNHELTKHFLICYFKSLLIVFDHIMLMQTGRIFRTYFDIEDKYVSGSKVNYFNYDYAKSNKSIKLSILSKDGYFYEAKKFMSELNKDCDKFKIQV